MSSTVDDIFGDQIFEYDSKEQAARRQKEIVLDGERRLRVTQVAYTEHSVLSTVEAEVLWSGEIALKDVASWYKKQEGFVDNTFKYAYDIEILLQEAKRKISEDG